MSPRQRGPGSTRAGGSAPVDDAQQPEQQEQHPQQQQPSQQPQQQRPPSGMLPRGVLMLVATGLAAMSLALQNPDVQQQLQSHVLPLQEKLLPLLNHASNPFRRDRLLTAAELAQYTSDNPAGGGKIYVAILGEVFDVTSKPQFYGAGEGYSHFAGTDGSKSFITGDFENDVTDDVSELDAEACHGLVGWRDFYLKTYPRVGRRVGRFYDATGKPTAELADVHEKAREGQRLKDKQEDEVAKWPNCNSKWTEAEGGSVWCDNGLYPRKLYVTMVNGQPNWRCACFKELGWNDLRQVYPGCDPDAHRCLTNPSLEEEAARSSDEAAMSLINSL